MATTYGGSSPGYHGWWFTVNVCSVAMPDTGSGSSDDPKHCGQRGPYGCT